jgi:RNA polymerase sigma factor (sigma-70 family)
VSDSTPTVFIVDDDAAIRDSLSLLLGLRGHATRCFATAEEFLAAHRPQWSGCVLVDLRMPGIGGLRLHEEMTRRGIGLPVIIVTAYGDIRTARATLKAGAVDFIEKPVDHEQLIASIRDALDIAARDRSRAAEARNVRSRIARLTAREREVLDRVVEGRHNREIALELGISPRTVEVYKSRMMEKLQVERLPDLVRLVQFSDTQDAG